MHSCDLSFEKYVAVTLGLQPPRYELLADGTVLDRENNSAYGKVIAHTDPTAIIRVAIRFQG